MVARALAHPFSCTTAGLADGIGTGLSLTIYPNPANGICRLQVLEPVNEPVTLTLHDMFGQRLMTKQLVELKGEQVLDISKVAAGNYFLEVETESGKRMTLKLVVQ
jgi:hypothetical protein